MSNTTDNIYCIDAALRGSCRIAYVINNEQPVKCSIVSDQPLFYMDFECEDDYIDEVEEAFDFTAIETGVAELQARVERLSRFGEMDEEEDMTDHFADFLEEAYTITAEADEASQPADIAFLEKSLRESRLAGAFIDFAADYGTKLCYDTQIADAVYDRQGGNIHINPNLTREDQILLAVRELRRVWQHRNGALLNPMTFHPDQAVLVNRAQIADLAVIMVRIAWELQLAGDKAPWERIERTQMTDLARAFARESYLDFRTLNNGVAQSAVFESWFLSERCRHEDKKLIQMMLADYHGYVFDTAQASQNITAELIIALGSMPFGKNYLAPYVSTIMNDDIFTEVRDRSNANFLWFIKFERSFRETEQELQTGKDTTGHDFNDGRILENQKRFGDHEETTEIITLPFGGDGTSSSEAGSASAGNIIQFRQRSSGNQ